MPATATATSTPSTPKMPRLFAYPSEVSLDASAIMSWNQVARTGSFVSSRYGPFQITKKDLSDMLQNFMHVTPKAPTELPIDFDHLSMEIKQVGDGVAAGWMKELALRDEGNELWARIEWTPQAAEMIRTKQYRFVSPSFVKDHTDRDTGKKIGTTLLAAAITNHPFLQQMAALTLYSFSALGDLGVLEDSAMKTPARATHLAETDNLAAISTVVGLSPDALKVPEVTDDERGGTFVVKAVSEDGNFVRLVVKDDPTKEVGWFAKDQLVAARAPEAQGSPLPQNTVPNEMPIPAAPTGVSASDRLNAIALDLQRTKNITFNAAVKLAVDRHKELVTGFFQAVRSEPEVAIEPEIPSISVKHGESFTQLVLRIATEKQLTVRDAVVLCSNAQPALARRYELGDGL